MRVLYSFPHRIGAGRICTTAWYQVDGASKAGAEIVAFVGSVDRPLHDDVRAVETLARGRARLPYRVVGSQRMFRLHDRITASWLRRHRKEIDLVHVWPSGAFETIKAARDVGIPTLLERPNAHTRFAYEVVGAESSKLGVSLPADHEHAYKPEVLAREEAEFAAADKLLCPSEFTMKTFRDAGHPEDQLVRHFYGVDPAVFHPGEEPRADGRFTAIFVGVAAVRKGLHYALEAWHRSTASIDGRFLIAGEMLPDYRRVLAPMLDHPSVVELGHRDDVPELLRQTDVLVLPSIEEGCPLVCAEAIASGCVPLVSEACTALCVQDVNACVHAVGDVDCLSAQLSLMAEDERSRRMLRDGGLRMVDEISWDAAGVRLAEIYAATARRSQPSTWRLEAFPRQHRQEGEQHLQGSHT
jgi:glycosyltransferase involved in cell wall biosynthesis